MFLPPCLCPKVRRVDGLNAEMLGADGFGSRAGEHRVRCEAGCEVECTDEVGGVLGAGEEGDGDAAARGWHGGVGSRGFGKHEGRFEFVLWSIRQSVCEQLCRTRNRQLTLPATLKTAPLPALKRGLSVDGDVRYENTLTRNHNAGKSQLYGKCVSIQVH